MHNVSFLAYGPKMGAGPNRKFRKLRAGPIFGGKSIEPRPLYYEIRQLSELAALGERQSRKRGIIPICALQF